MFKDVSTVKKGQMALDTGSSALVLKVRIKHVGLRQVFFVEKEIELNFRTASEQKKKGLNQENIQALL